MTALLDPLFGALASLWEMSLTAAYAAAVVALLRIVLKRRTPRQIMCLLWLVVFARLLIPVYLESPLSIVPDGEQVQAVRGLRARLTGERSVPVLDPGPLQDHGAAQTGGAVSGQTSQSGSPADAGTAPLFPTLTLPGSAAPGTQSQPPAAFPWLALMAVLWLAGAAAMCLYAAASCLRLKSRLYDAIRSEDGAWEHPAVSSPFILGVFRPRVYLPAGLRGMPRKFILCHERAHLRRLDHIVKPVCWLALSLHWFNPAAWLAFVLMSRDIEAACDEAVIRQLGPRVKADYSATLLSLATNGRIPAPCPLAFDEGNAKGRIQNVLRYRRPALWIVVVSVIMVLAAAVCLLTDPVCAEKSGPDPSPSAVPVSINVPIPLDDYALAAPVPDFLDEEQQLLYRQTYSLYGHIFGANTEEVDNWPGHIGYDFGNGDVIERDGGYYVPATGLYAGWADFEEAVLSVFTRDFWERRNDTGSNKLYINEGGTLYYQAAARGSGGGNPNFPDTFRLVEKTEDTISFVMTGYYSDSRPYYGIVSDAKKEAWLAAGWESSIDFPMRMVKTENGWRFDEFHYAATDNFFFQEVPNPDAPVMDEIPEPVATPFVAPDTVCPHGLEHAAFRAMDGQWELSCTVDRFAYTRISSDYYYSMPENWDLDGDGSKEAVTYTKDGQIVLFDVENGRLNTYNFDPASVNQAFRENCSVEIINDNQQLRLSYEGQTILVAAQPDFFLHYDSEASEPGVYRDQTTYALGNDGLFLLSTPVDMSSYGALETPVIHWSIRYTGSGHFQTVPGSFQF